MSEQSPEDAEPFRQHLQMSERAYLNLEAYRQRRQAFEEGQFTRPGIAIDVNDLIGADGQRLESDGLASIHRPDS
jgi:hypothetical protein